MRRISPIPSPLNRLVVHGADTLKHPVGLIEPVVLSHMEMKGLDLVFADIGDFPIEPMGEELVDLPFIIFPRLLLNLAVALHVEVKEQLERDFLSQTVLLDVRVLSAS